MATSAVAAPPPRPASPDAPRILVCRGVDCAGLGSAATLLELEELCAHARGTAAGEDDPLGALTVCAVACTNQCAFAPTVSTAGRAGCDSYKKIDSARRCADVLRSVTDRLGPGSAGARAAAPADGPMQWRAAGMRFRALKLMGRGDRAGRALLEEAIAAEKSAAGGCPRRLARAVAREANYAPTGCLAAAPPFSAVPRLE